VRPELRSISKSILDCLDIQDEPLGMISFFPLWRLVQAVSSHSRILISGEGGDEFFLGYSSPARWLHQEMAGGTFTISNGGVYGSLMSTPILNPPQSGILGLHKIEERPVAIQGKVEVRPMMYVALSYDHRIIDGGESVSFLVKIKEGLEDPARLLLEI